MQNKMLYNNIMETIKLRKSKGAKTNSDITFKKGALRRQLKMPRGVDFTKADINRLKKIKIGSRFRFKGNDFTKTKLMSERIDLAHTLMGFKKRGRKKETKEHHSKGKHKMVKLKNGRMAEVLPSGRYRFVSSKKGAPSKTHPGDKDYTTKKGDKDYHESGHDQKRKRKPYSR